MKERVPLTRRRLLRHACALAATVPLTRVLVACGAEEETPQARTGGGVAPGAPQIDEEGAGQQAPAPPQPPAAQQPPTAQQPEPAPGAPQAQAEQPGTDGQLVTEIPAMQPLVQSLQYVHESPNPDQRCDNCLFFTQVSEERGRCQLFPQGLVRAPGWCASWQQRAPGAAPPPS